MSTLFVVAESQRLSLPISLALLEAGVPESVETIAATTVRQQLKVGPFDPRPCLKELKRHMERSAEQHI